MIVDHDLDLAERKGIDVPLDNLQPRWVGRSKAE
jgi:hypothetical protein